MFGEKLEKSKIITIFVCLIGAILVANLIGGGNIKLDAIGILAGVVNGIGVALQILLPKFSRKIMTEIHCLSTDFLERQWLCCLEWILVQLQDILRRLR